MKLPAVTLLLLSCLLALLLSTATAAVGDSTTRYVDTPSIENSDHAKEPDYDDEDSDEDISDHDSDEIDAVEKGVFNENPVHDLRDPIDSKPSRSPSDSIHDAELIPDDIIADKPVTIPAAQDKDKETDVAIEGSVDKPILSMKALINGLIDDLHRRSTQPSIPANPEIPPRHHKKRVWSGRDLERRGRRRGYAKDGVETDQDEVVS